MTIYIDIIFLENLIMNYIILFVVAYILKKRIIIWKMFLSSTLGSLYSIIVYLDLFQIYTNLLVKIFLSIVMVYIAYSANSIRKLLRELTVFYLISFLFGGCAFAIIYIILPNQIIKFRSHLVGTYPIKITIVAGILGFVISNIVFKVIRKKTVREDLICNIEIYLEDNKVNTVALLDTGNLLKEPISGRPVIIVEKEVLKEIVPENILNNLLKIIGGDYEDINSKDYEKYMSKFKIIPFSSIGKENGMLLGILVDKIKIYYEESNEEVKNVVVGIYENKLTKTKKYKALLGLGILERSVNDEHF